MKNYIFLVSILLSLSSCSEDVSRNITTDLTQEADQLFRFSEALIENSYLGNISYSDYSRISSDQLPGCPTITIKAAERIVELDYTNTLECEQGNKSPRSGKIILDFPDSSTSEVIWTMTYAEYFFKGTKIEGVRNFRNPAFGENNETIENLRIQVEKNLGFTFSGSFSYSIARLSSKPFALSTRGMIEGTNPAGRDFSLIITQAKEQLFSCYGDGWELPQSGNETWIISRSFSTGLEYRVDYQTNDGCNPSVTSTLPDGRSLQLNP